MVEPAARDVPPPRLLLPSSHADLRMTWHHERGFVVSLWHGQVCAASAPLSAEHAAKVAGFVVDHLGAQAADADAAAERERVRDPEREVQPTTDLAVVGDDRPPPPGPTARAVAALDEAIAAGGAAVSAGVEAARRAWRARRS